MKNIISIVSIILLSLSCIARKSIPEARNYGEIAERSRIKLGETEMTLQDQHHLQVAIAMTSLTKKYTDKEITASEFALEMTKYMTDDVVFWSNYIPSWEPLRPLFSERRGIKEIIERYDYENRHEEIKGGTGIPFDFSINGDVIYYSQNETASFFNKQDVSWCMVTKMIFKDGKIARIEMFLDPAPIEKVYGDSPE